MAAQPPEVVGPYAATDLPAGSVRDYVAELEHLGQAAFRRCGWLQRLRASGTVEPAPEVDMSGVHSRHYVAGAMAPLVLERFRAPLGSGRGLPEYHELVWAVYFGEYARNAANTVHGGAIAAVCDYIGASLGNVTAWLRVDYRQGPPRTDDAVWKLSAWVSEVKQNGRRKKVEVELCDGETGKALCTAEGEFVDTSMPRPPRL